MKHTDRLLSIVNSVCNVIFFAFAFVYLLLFQSDVLAYAQYRLSEGVTTYNATVGAFVITATLALVSFVTSRVSSCMFRSFTALCHIPAALLLASITDINVNATDNAAVFGSAWIVSLVLLMVYALVNYVLRKVKPAAMGAADFAGYACINLVIMLVSMVYVVSMANTDEVDHIVLRAEKLIDEGQYDDAYGLITKYDVNSTRLTALKAFALGRTNRMGDEFFKTRFVAGTDYLLPRQTDGSSSLLMTSDSVIYQKLGGVPSRKLSAKTYLQLMEKRGMMKPMGKDYLLTAYLLERDIDSFAQTFLASCDTTQVVPKHYAEALMLCQRRSGNHDTAAFATPEMEADFEDFMELKEKSPEQTRENAVRDQYGNTYWFYFFFTSSKAFTQSVSSEN